MTEQSQVFASWGSFALTPDSVLFSDVSANAVRLFATLHKYSTMPDGALPSRATVAALMHVSTDTVDRALKELVEAGFVAVTHRWRTPDGEEASGPGRGAIQSSSRYDLMPNLPAPVRRGSRKDAEGVAAPVPIPQPQGCGTNKNDLNKNEPIRSEQGFVNISRIELGNKSVREPMPNPDLHCKIGPLLRSGWRS